MTGTTPHQARRRVLGLLLAAAGAATLTACGRKGNPVPPEDFDPCSPRHYPMDLVAKEACARQQRQRQEELEQKKQDQQQSPDQTPPDQKQ